ncbi:hypothetical protein KCP73_14230 [Salmonella enterica subsp. enterica]|nr:hypothetical protein KCP73_14230 [Salmonella enterica subsp. enterica]
MISALLSGYVQQKFSGPWFGGLSGVVYALMGRTCGCARSGSAKRISGLQRSCVNYFCIIVEVAAGLLVWACLWRTAARTSPWAYRRFSDGLCWMLNARKRTQAYPPGGRDIFPRAGRANAAIRRALVTFGEIGS